MAQWLQRMRHSAMVRKHLIEVAMELATQHGLAAISMRRVAALAGVSPGSVQHHFRHVDALRQTVLDFWCRELGDIVLGPARKATHGVALVWAVAEAWLAWSERLPIPFHGLSAPRSSEFSAVDLLAADWFELTRAALQRGKLLGELTETTDPVALAFDIHARMWAVPWAWSVLPRRERIERTASAIHDRLLRSSSSTRILPLLSDRVKLILDVAERLMPDRARPDPHRLGATNAAGLVRYPFEDLFPADAPERMEWEERHGLPTRSQPLKPTPDWWSCVTEPWPEPASAQANVPPSEEALSSEEKALLDRALGLAPPEAPGRKPTAEELAEFERQMAEQRARGEEERRRDAESYARAEALRNAP